jgi:hypothetical protein
MMAKSSETLAWSRLHDNGWVASVHRHSDGSYSWDAAPAGSSESAGRPARSLEVAQIEADVDVATKTGHRCSPMCDPWPVSDSSGEYVAHAEADNSPDVGDDTAKG